MGCGGWKLEIPKAGGGRSMKMDWPWWSFSRYRNDIESISVAPGCTFTGWDDHGFSGRSITVAARGRSTKHAFTDDDEYEDLHEDIEALECPANSSSTTQSTNQSIHQNHPHILLHLIHC